MSVKPIKHILLIDGEGVLHTAFHKFSNLKSTDGKPSGAIFGFFRLLHKYFVRFYPTDVYITFDNGHSKKRMELNPHYKEHRKNISINYESLQQQKAVIIKMLGMLRIKYIFDKKKLNDYEGDDFLAYTLLKYLPEEKGIRIDGKKGYKFIIITSDKDFNQLLSGEQVKIYNQRKDEIVTVRNCQELFGYSSNETVDWLSMVGDQSDDIKGIPGVGPVRARKILDEFGTLNNYLEHHHQTSHVEIAERNKKLIDLHWWVDNVPMVKFPLKEYKNSEMKLEKFKNLAIEYSLSSFLTNDFIQPFKDLHE